MQNSSIKKADQRYQSVTKEKSSGATYTPVELADFVAEELTASCDLTSQTKRIRVLDPASGEGELIISLLNKLMSIGGTDIEVTGFDTDKDALQTAEKRISSKFPNVTLISRNENFLEYIGSVWECVSQSDMFHKDFNEKFDLIIANPPYVRTQVMGAASAQKLAKQYGLKGRVDLYFAFLLGISHALADDGAAGIIVSNRFMTTKSGGTVRKALFERFDLRKVFDFGDTKLFDAAVLPAVLIARGGRQNAESEIEFSSIYETQVPADEQVENIPSAIRRDGVVSLPDGRTYVVQKGKLSQKEDKEAVWQVSTPNIEIWLDKVRSNTWRTFKEVGKVRVGVKTCADKVFIRNDWEERFGKKIPELVRPLTTHHVARRFRPRELDESFGILYPHGVVNGKRQPVPINDYPLSAKYMSDNAEVLQKRKYVIEAGREWYEIWVPQNPELWNKPKVVFRDIAEQPTFWLDDKGTVVNGDCYWMVNESEYHDDILWLILGISNSKFIEEFYDNEFNNKLYAGRRRFITQYVEKFPIPDPAAPLSKEIISKAKQAFHSIEKTEFECLEVEINNLVWRAFGLGVEKVSG